MSKTKVYYDNTKMRSFQTCRYKYFLRHLKGYVPESNSNALRFGSAIHEALSIWYETGDLDKALKAFSDYEDDVNDEKRTASRGIDIMNEYVQVYSEEPFDIIANEVPFETLILETADTKYYLIGKIDLIVDWSSGIYGLDHKTTSQLGDYYFERYKLSRQMMGYTLALKNMYGNSSVSGMLINAIAVYKNRFKFERQPVTYMSHKLSWYESSIKRLMARMKAFDDRVKDLSPTEGKRRIVPNWDSCQNYGRCPYQSICQSKRPDYEADRNYEIDFWDPREELTKDE